MRNQAIPGLDYIFSIQSKDALVTQDKLIQLRDELVTQEELIQLRDEVGTQR